MRLKLIYITVQSTKYIKLKSRERNLKESIIYIQQKIIMNIKKY